MIRARAKILHFSFVFRVTNEKREERIFNGLINMQIILEKLFKQREAKQ